VTLTLEQLSPWGKARARWRLMARNEQIFPESEPWDVAFFMAGRGAGKTRSGAEDSSEYARTHEDARLALVGPTAADVRDTMIEGESGLLGILPPSALRNESYDDAWNRSMGELYFSNGTKVKAYSSEKPDRLRGPQHHRAWVDEPGAFRDAHKGDVLDTTWNNLMLGLRVGERPRVVVTGTPKRVKLVREILKRPRLHLVRGSTYDNLANLAPTFRATILNQYEGTRLGRQELLGELLEDVEGALWSQPVIDAGRVAEPDPLNQWSSGFKRAVIAIDPAVTSGEDADLTGIVGAASTDSRWCPACGPVTACHAFVLMDVSGRFSPDVWARRAIDAYDDIEGDRIIGEANNGGDMVELTVRTVDAGVPFTKVHASRGKRVRAEPVAALYEQGRVHHVGTFPELEDQLTTWTPDSGESPDRLDALVWALTDLMLGTEHRKMRYRGAA
jgi:phage terminase large subunit-like protein